MKHKYVALILGILITPILSLFVMPVDTVSALTHQECFDTYHNRNFRSEDAAVQEFRQSDCNSAQRCQLRDSGGGGGLGNVLISCIDPRDPGNPCNPVTYDREACNERRGTTNCDAEAGLGDCAAQTTFDFSSCGNSDVSVRCLVNEVLLFMSIAVGILVVAGIIWGGITYSTSQGSPAQTQKGITIIVNAAIGLILYLLMFALIRWLLPGDVIN